MRHAFTFAIVLFAAFTAFAAEPFNGKTLDGWKFKKHGEKNQPHWVAGAASVNAADPRLLDVKPGGSELVNHVSGHGQGVDAYSEQTFGDAVIELEVMVPKGSNSGIYVMGEYEVQVFDSFGKESNPGPGDMGAIYGAAPPTKPIYKKHGEWSKYEIQFRAPRFDAAGKKTENARFIKVVLNGATIHENVEMKNGPTPGGITGQEHPQGPIMFQGDHGPVSYRNIRVKPLGNAAINPEEEVLAVERSDRVVTLFDGSNLSHWQHEKGGEPKWTVSQGLLTIVPGSGGIMTKESYSDFKLHLEFNIQPAPRNEVNTQLNGNSGVYIQRRYEVQILDTHGRPPEVNGCGAIYKQRAPTTNAAKKAGEWQTYDIIFHAAKWSGATKTANARITVVHNGVTIHDHVEITAKTGAGQPEGPDPAPILLQEHGNVVSFRKITVTQFE